MLEETEAGISPDHAALRYNIGDALYSIEAHSLYPIHSESDPLPTAGSSGFSDYGFACGFSEDAGRNLVARGSRKANHAPLAASDRSMLIY